MMTEKRGILLFSPKPNQAASELEDELALDEPVCIFINGEYHVTLIATPTMKRELAVGYLLTEGIIDSKADIKTMDFRENDVLIELREEVDLREASVGMMNLIVTACGSRVRGAAPVNIPKIESDVSVEASKIIDMCMALNRRSSIHRITGGTHAAMLCTKDGEVLSFAEDVGRHNAVDKVIGSMLLEGRDPDECVLVSTGRLSGEMVQKAGRGGIPVVASITVPLTSGVRLAEMIGLTLISLWRGRLKVYSNPQRVKVG